MRKKNNKKWALVLVLLLVVSIGYAALASNLKINGTTGVKSATWDVYWNNVQINPESVSTTTGNQARITDQAKTQVEYSVTLNEPGDFYEFTVDAVNNGTIDAMIASQGIVNGVYSDSTYETPATLPEAVSYTVTYADGKPIQEKHLLAKKNGNTPTTETYKVRIEYKNDDSIDPEDLDNDNDQTYYFKFSVNYVQADSTAIDKNASASAIHYVSRQNEGQITPGDVIGIGETEDFYVVSSDEQKTVLLGKYNLLVGDGEAASLDAPGYGLQSVDALGYFNGTQYSSEVFSTTNYWMSENNLLSPYNRNDTIYFDNSSSQNYWEWQFKYRNDDSVTYPYVYDENSEIYQYINGDNGYVNRLKSMGAPSTITGRLLTYEEADAVKEVGRVDIDDDKYTSIIFNGQSYWLGSAGNNYEVWDVEPYTYMYHIFHNYNSGPCAGVRPVIEIPTSELQ